MAWTLRRLKPSRSPVARAWFSSTSSSSLRTEETYDCLVIGGGVMGAWAAVMARKAFGASVLLADQFAPAHDHGSSHGDGRIYRLAYTEDIYVDMMLRSLPLWHELQTFAEEPLLAQTGGINIAPIDGGRLDALGELYSRRGFAHEWLSAGAANERFPQFRLSEGQQHALYQPDFGVLFATKCVAAVWRYAEALGVHTLTPFRASSLQAEPAAAGCSDLVTVVGEDGRAVKARSVVLAPGAWLSPLANALLGLSIPTHVSAETVCYYAPKPEPPVDHSYRSMPVFIPETSNGLGPFGYYGLPMIDIPGIKCSAHYCGPSVDPDQRPLAAGGVQGVTLGRGQGPGVEGDARAEAVAAARVQAVIDSTSEYITSTFPHVEHAPFQTQTCLYTSTPDHDYILSRTPTNPRVVLAGGGSGHAFKMGPAIGEGAACLALGQPPPLDVRRFDVERLLGLQGSALDHEASAPRR